MRSLRRNFIISPFLVYFFLVYFLSLYHKKPKKRTFFRKKSVFYHLF